MGLNTITENTTIKLGFVLLIIGLFVGGIFQAGKAAQRIENIEARLIEVESVQSITPTRIEIDDLKNYIEKQFDELKTVLGKK